MREILFRGKRKYSGEWVEGDLIHSVGRTYCGIFGETLEEIDPQTVGQFTEMYDCTKWEDLTLEEQEAFLHQPDGWENTPDLWHGKKIFGGDIIEWDEKVWGCGCRELVEWDYSLFSVRENDWQEFCKVIGNVHDNPELLEDE